MSEVVTKTKKTLVPVLRFKEFEGDWNYKQLNEICSFYSGGTPTSSNKEFYNGDIPFIGSGNIFDSKVSNYITEEALNSSSAKIVEVGDLLYALYGANSGEVGISKMSGAINQAILCIRTESEKIDFIHCLLVLNKDKIVGKYLQGGQGNLSANIVKKLKYHFPSLPEQQKIASFLAAIDKKIQQLTKKKALLEDYKKGVMQQLFSGKLRFKDANGNDYPDWEEKRLKEITKINQGLQIAISERFLEPVEDGYFYITNEFLRANSEKSYFIKSPPESVICNEDDILMTRTGNTGQVVTGVNGAFHNNFFKIKYQDHCEKWFLYYFLTSQLTQHTILKLAGTSTIPDLNHGDFYKIKIELPSIKEQAKISSVVKSIDTKIEAVNNQITQTQQFKKGLLQQMFVAA